MMYPYRMKPMKGNVPPTYPSVGFFTAPAFHVPLQPFPEEVTIPPAGIQPSPAEVQPVSVPTQPVPAPVSAPVSAVPTTMSTPASGTPVYQAPAAAAPEIPVNMTPQYPTFSPQYPVYSGSSAYPSYSVNPLYPMYPGSLAYPGYSAYPNTPANSNMGSSTMSIGRPAAARLKGSPLTPDLYGLVTFRDVPGGTQVTVEVKGLPAYKPAQDGKAPVGPHGFHIHQDGCCDIGNPETPFECAKGHWNPDNQPHGHHAGDFPVLFSNNGYAKMSFFTNRFRVSDVVGKAVIIHENPDDYRSQPAGDSGKKIACGVIRYY